MAFCNSNPEIKRNLRVICVINTPPWWGCIMMMDSSYTPHKCAYAPLWGFCCITFSTLYLFGTKESWELRVEKGKSSPPKVGGVRRSREEVWEKRKRGINNLRAEALDFILQLLGWRWVERGSRCVVECVTQKRWYSGELLCGSLFG